MGERMKTPEEIKKGLHTHITSVECKPCPYENCEQQGAAHNCIHLMCKGVFAYIQQLEAQVPKWISVEERLPEDDTNVLVYAIGNNEHSVIAMTEYTHNMYGYNIEGWCAPWQYFFHEYKITHWMPLPELPKEGKQ